VSDSAIVTSSRGGLKCFELFRRNDDEDNFYVVAVRSSSASSSTATITRRSKIPELPAGAKPKERRKMERVRFVFCLVNDSSFVDKAPLPLNNGNVKK
jgi:hypothetical protein